jgi:TPR repeat protein
MSSTSDTDRVDGFEQAVQRGDNEIAIQLLMALAEQGHSVSQLLLGCLCLGNPGLGGNERAFEFISKAAERNIAKAQWRLGHMYSTGKGVARSESHACYWYYRAAEQGLAEAQFSLGLACIEGRGVAINQNRAVTWLKRAADQGHADAQGVLGAMYASGNGATKDEQLATELLTKSANQGRTNAQFVLDLHRLDQSNGLHLSPDEVPGVVAFLRELYHNGGRARH